MRLCAFRRLWNAPGYAAAAIVTLALAIGASTAIFSAVYAVLLKPMPIREPQQLAIGWGTSAALNMRVIELSYLDIQDIGEATAQVGRVASVGSSAWTDVLEGDGGGEPVKVASTGVSGTFFEVLGAVAAARTHDRSRRRSDEQRAGRGAQPRAVVDAVRRGPEHHRAKRAVR